MIDGRIFRLRKQLSENLSHNWTVEEMASGFGLSVPHFQRLFKSHTGKTPFAYLRDLRLERAAYLLANTFESIKRIGAISVQSGGLTIWYCTYGCYCAGTGSGDWFYIEQTYQY